MNKMTLKDRKNVASVAAHMLEDPIQALGGTFQSMHSIERKTLEEIQLAALKRRFDQLRNSVPMLKKLADEQGVSEINSLDEVVPLLFKHTVYKSYPISLLEKNKFKQLTQWLSKLTTCDLSSVDVSQCQGIDDWIKVLDEKTELSLRHSSGTTGTVSFLPRTKGEAAKHSLIAMFGIFSALGQKSPTADAPFSMHVIHGNFRTGSTSHLRVVDDIVKYVCGGDESKFHSLYPGHQSADLMFLAGRLRAAEARGDTIDRLDLSPALLARKSEFDELQKRRATDSKAFYDDIVANLKGERIYMLGTWNILFSVASAGLAVGLENVFSPDSVIATGGGAKGQVVPDDWEDQVKKFFGVKKIIHQYGMSEVMGTHKLCDHGRYHMEPMTILFLVDPDTGEPLPRSGVQTGRACFYDLLAGTSWGGFVSGDELTVDWNPCACGFHSPSINRKIERYSEKRGGDDKISCAAASDAHESALTYLTDIGG